MSETEPGVPASEKRISGAPVLVVLAILLALLAGLVVLVVPHLRPPRPPHTIKNITHALGIYVAAQSKYRHTDWDKDGELEYCRDYARGLNRRMGIPPVEGVSSAFAAARGPEGTPMWGYRFLEMETIASRPIEWVNDFALCATPAKYGEIGIYTMIVATDGVVWYKDFGKSRFIKNYPANPRAAGWHKWE
jgi:hypothetical protein